MADCGRLALVPASAVVVPVLAVLLYLHFRSSAPSNPSPLRHHQLQVQREPWLIWLLVQDQPTCDALQVLVRVRVLLEPRAQASPVLHSSEVREPLSTGHVEAPSASACARLGFLTIDHILKWDHG
jgi:hypothetical protein